MTDQAASDPGTDSDEGENETRPSWTPPSSQEELNRIIEQRLKRERARFADYEALKEKASRVDKMEFDLSSEADKAAARAREEERTKVRGEFVPRVVRAEFKAEAKGVLSGDQLEALLEDIDLSRYVNDNGEPDTEKITAKIAKLAPAKEDRREFPDLGAGNRGGAAKSLNMNDLIRRQAGVTG